jgi:colicin import membrane protein
MKRQLIVASWLLLAAGCEKSAEEQQTKATQAQREADEKAMKAGREATEKADKAQQEANQETAKAQAKANDTIRNAHEDLLKDRNDFQVEAHKALDDLDGRVDKLRAKAQKADAKARSNFDVAVRDVEAKRATVVADIQRLEAQTAESFDGFKARVNKELDEAKKSVDNAASKL